MDFRAVGVNELERSVINIDSKILEQERERDNRLLTKLDGQIRKQISKIDQLSEKATAPSRDSRISKAEEELEELKAQRQTVLSRLEETQTRDGDGMNESSETQRDLMIRSGKITPFNDESLLDNRPVHTFFGHQKRKHDSVEETEEEPDEYSDASQTDDDADDNSATSDEPPDEEDYQDDGTLERYRQRINSWLGRQDSRIEMSDALFEYHGLYSPDADARFDESFRLPGQVYERLFGYQRIGVKWLWELCQQKVGGIVGDEMGLGKTIQVITFLGGLFYSRQWKGASIIVCPATVMKQWVQEFHEWWPAFRVVMLHPTGSAFQSNGLAASATVKKVIEEVHSRGHILIITYEGCRLYNRLLIAKRWGFLVLDEGHKIRNPDADITICCKRFSTHHRIILSGTPIQNNLRELWSLFDFIFPGRLGTLPVFESQFSTPIRLGGYVNASAVQVQAAYKCACILRDLINPYLLRRMKMDVAADAMPQKNEQVIFCRLTTLQRRIYEDFIESSDLQAIFDGKRKVFHGIDILRKICNHPDLLLKAPQPTGKSFGDYKKSGKLAVVRSLLENWKAEGHRVLLFSQTRQMQDIIERMVSGMGLEYRRMDGNTPVKDRIPMVDEFNANSGIFIFLLTTKVGGLGINLTGADRVIIFDPDWNPSTDMQARERAWRLGQKRDVTIYRLMTSGTIEEKIYHRQIFKQYLTNKILRDPKQKRFFKSNDLHDLFSLAPEDQESNETKDIFSAANDHADKNQEASDKTADPILDSLFKAGTGGTGSGIHAILEHDSVMDQMSKPEKLLIDQESSRVAEGAMSALRSSRVERRRVAIQVPTWTGKSGSAGAPADNTNKPPLESFAGTQAGFSSSSSSSLRLASNPTNSRQLLDSLQNNDGSA